ncbi:MFS general substrate transporter [Meredithblackwellia eburnea MCA 4105]
MDLSDDVREWKDDIVDWSSPSDPANPKNWSLKHKYIVTAMLGATTMCSTFASAIFSAAIPYTAERYGVSQEIMTLGTSLFVLGYVPGPILFAPLSEMYGRRTVWVPMFCFLCLSAGTATADRLETIFVTRFFAGLCASAPVTTVGGGLADMFDQKERGTAVVVYSLAVVAGPTLAPIIGASVSQSYLGWRWTEFLVCIMTGVITFFGSLFIPETFAPVLLTAKASKLRRKTGRWVLHSKHEMNDFTLKNFLETHLTRPLLMIVKEPMVFCITLYNSFTYGILYMLFSAVPIMFEEDKGWTPVEAALPFLAVLIGTLTAASINILYSTFVFGPYVDKHGGSAKPEMRLPTMMLGGIAFPVGFFLLGWAPTAGQLIGLVFIGASFLLIFQSGINYLIDGYTRFSASAVASNTFMRSLFAAGLPFAAQPLFHNLGTGLACTVLGCIVAVLGAVPFLFFIFGPKLRGMSRFAAKH